MSRVVISCRRSEATTEANLICNYLESHLGSNVVSISEDMQGSEGDFQKQNHETLEQCEVLIAVISKGWLQGKDEQGNRLIDTPTDPIRLALETALARNLRIMPVFLEGVANPSSDDLPESLRLLFWQRSSFYFGRSQKALKSTEMLVFWLKRYLNLEPNKKAVVTVAVVSNSGKNIEIERQWRDSFTESLGCGVTLDLVPIPEGTFTMGSPSNEDNRRDNEGPQHEVTVPSLLIGRHPITRSQWQAVATLPKVAQDFRPLGDRTSHTQDDVPIEYVSWAEAVEFCKRLSLKSKKDYRLPSEAEWEYACRAGTTTPFYFGETINNRLACFRSGKPYIGGSRIDPARPNPVDCGIPANVFGLRDMHGRGTNLSRENICV